MTLLVLKPEPALNADQLCEYLKAVIESLGSMAFAHDGLIQAYSGPSDNIKAIIGNRFQNNWYLSKDQAARLGAVRIDETVIGQFLIGLGLKEYFSEVYGKDPEARKEAIDQVWAFASQEFLRQNFHHVVTAVCGAGAERVFRAFELAELAQNPHIETVNDRAKQRIVEIYYAQGAYVAFREICKTELDMARLRAHNENTPEAWEDFRGRLTFFKLECKETAEILRDNRENPSGELAALCAKLWQNEPARPFGQERQKVSVSHYLH